MQKCLILGWGILKVNLEHHVMPVSVKENINNSEACQRNRGLSSKTRNVVLACNLKYKINIQKPILM